jgi:hypothetical protein
MKKIALFLSLVAAAALALLGAMKSSKVRGIAASALAAEAGRALGMKVELKGLEIGYFPPSVGLKGVSVLSKDGRTTLFSSPEVRAEFALFQFLLGGVYINRLEVRSPVADITPLFPGPVTSGGPGRGAVAQRGGVKLPLYIRETRLENLSVRGSVGEGISVDVRGMNVTATADLHAMSFQGKLSGATGTAMVHGRELGFEFGASGFRYSDGSLSFENFHQASGSLGVRG